MTPVRTPGRCRIYNLNGNRLEKRAEIDVKNRTGRHRKGTKVTGIVRANVGDHTFIVSTHDSRIRLLQVLSPSYPSPPYGTVPGNNTSTTSVQVQGSCQRFWSSHRRLADGRWVLSHFWIG